jgi:hypothetical protein
MAGAQDATELVVASHGDIWVAPVGTALPTSVSATPNAAFIKLGLVSEDGVAFSNAPEIESYGAWQRKNPVRRERVSETTSLSFALEQWNADTVTFAFGGGAIVDLGGNSYRYDAPDQDDALDERAIILDWQDGPNSKYRFVAARGNVSDAVETTLSRSALALLPIAFEVLGPDTGPPWQLYVDDAAFHS